MGVSVVWVKVTKHQPTRLARRTDAETGGDG